MGTEYLTQMPTKNVLIANVTAEIGTSNGDISFKSGRYANGDNFIAINFDMRNPSWDMKIRSRLGGEVRDVYTLTMFSYMSLEEAYKLSIALNEYIADNRRYLDDIIKEREEIMSEMETEMDSNFGEEEL